MSKLFDIQEVKKSLYDAVATVSKNRFLTRPQSVSKAMSDFVVVSLPAQIQPRTYGYEQYLSETIGRITLFARDKNGEQNIKALQKMIDATMALFPLHNNTITAFKPTIIDLGSDGEGFHTIAIQFKLTIN